MVYRSRVTEPAKPPPSGLVALIVGALGIAFAPIFAKHAVNVDGGAGATMLSPVAVAFWRMALAAPFFWMMALRRSRSEGGAERTPSVGVPWWLLIVPGFCFACDLALWHWAFEFTSVANATLEANLAVVPVAVIGWWRFKEKLGFAFVVGAGLALGGTVLLVGAGTPTASTLFGDMLGVGAAVGYTGYLLATKVLVGRTSVARVMAWTCTSCAAFLLIVSLLSPQRLMPATKEAWLSLIALALVAQIAGQGLIAYGMRRLPAAFSAVTLIVQPLAAAVLAWILLGQALRSSQIAAGLVVILGIYLARIGSRQEATKQLQNTDTVAS